MGTAALTVASLCTLTSAVIALSPRAERTARTFFIVGAGFLAIAVARLGVAFASNQLQFAYVADNVRTGTGVAQRVAGLWAGSEGSLLLFTTVVGLMLAAHSRHMGRSELGFAALTTTGLALTTRLAASPFETLSLPPLDGRGVTPILEHPAMLVHPPLLYGGLALSLVPAVVSGSDRARSRATWAFVMLTVALVLGAGWAYVELGWGGWWAWDPVENVALIPWLLLVTTFHIPGASGIAGRRAIYAAIWPLVFAGTALTRTSLRTSVHAFADASSLRWWLWPLAGLTAAAAVVAMVAGRRAMSPSDQKSVPLPAKAHRLATSLLLICAVIVALGTFRPFVSGEGTEGWFYTRMLYPLAVVGAVAIGVAPRLWPAAGDRDRARRALVPTALLGTGAAIVALWVFGAPHWHQWLLAAALGAGVATLLGDPTSTLARRLGHLGMALVLVGALAGTASTRRTILLAPEASAVIAGRTITNEGLRVDDGEPRLADPQRLIATVAVADGDRRDIVMPSVGVYPARGLRLAEVATVSRFAADVQVILRSADDDGAITVTVNVRPLQQAVWIGAACLGIAGAAMLPRRRTVRWHTATV